MTHTNLNSRAKRQSLKRGVAAGALLAAILSASTVTAADITWDGNGTGDSWTNSANWTGDSVPTSIDKAIISVTTSASTHYTADIDTATATAHNVIIASSGTDGAAVTLVDGGTLTLGGQIIVNNSGGGYSVFHMRGGTLVVNNAAANENMFNVSGGTVYLNTANLSGTPAYYDLTIAAANGTTANLNSNFGYWDAANAWTNGLAGTVNINNPTHGGLVVFQTDQTVLADGVLNLASGSLGIASGNSLTLVSDATGTSVGTFNNILQGSGNTANDGVITAGTDMAKFTVGKNSTELVMTGTAIQTGDVRNWGTLQIGSATETGSYILGDGTDAGLFDNSGGYEIVLAAKTSQFGTGNNYLSGGAKGATITNGVFTNGQTGDFVVTGAATQAGDTVLTGRMNISNGVGYDLEKNASMEMNVGAIVGLRFGASAFDIFTGADNFNFSTLTAGANGAMFTALDNSRVSLTGGVTQSGLDGRMTITGTLQIGDGANAGTYTLSPNSSLQNTGSIVLEKEYVPGDTMSRFGAAAGNLSGGARGAEITGGTFAVAAAGTSLDLTGTASQTGDTVLTGAMSIGTVTGVDLYALDPEASLKMGAGSSIALTGGAGAANTSSFDILSTNGAAKFDTTTGATFTAGTNAAGELLMSGDIAQTGAVTSNGMLHIGKGFAKGDYTIAAGAGNSLDTSAGSLVIGNGIVTNEGTLTTGALLIKADPNVDHATAKLVMKDGSTNAVGNVTVDGGGMKDSAVLNIETGAGFTGATADTLTLQDKGVLAITQGTGAVASSPLNLHLAQGDGIVDVANGITMTAMSYTLPNQGVVYGVGNLVKDGGGKLVLAENNT